MRDDGNPNTSCVESGEGEKCVAWEILRRWDKQSLMTD